MSASTLSVAASSSLHGNFPDLYSRNSLTQIPPHFSKPKFFKPLKLKTLNPTSLTFSILSLSRFRRFSAGFDGFQASETNQKDPEDAEEDEEDVEQEEEEEEEEEKIVKGSNEDGRLYVGNLPYSITSSQLSEIFEEAGRVVSAEVVYDRVTDRSRGFGFVTMGTVEEAKEAIRLFDGSQVGGRTVKVNFPEVPRGGERAVMGPKIQNSYRGYVDSPHKIYAGNLGWGLTSQDLRDVFAEQPGLLSAKVIYERDTGRSRGFGFVTFETEEAVQSALNAMNGVEVEGRPLRLNLAAERAPLTPRSTTESNAESSLDNNELLSGISS